MLTTQKTPYYNSQEIKQGLLNIKKNQLELLQQLKYEHQILKKYSPTHNIPIRQQNHFLQQTNKPKKYLSQYNNSLFVSMTIQQVCTINQQLSSQKKELQKENQILEQNYKKIKKNYYIQKQKLKDLNLHMEFMEGIYSSILKDILYKINYQEISRKVNKQLKIYKLEYPQYRQGGLLRALQLINSIQPTYQYKDQKNINYIKQIQSLNRQINQLLQRQEDSNKQIINLSTINRQFQEKINLKDNQILMKSNTILYVDQKIQTLNDQIMRLLAENKQKKMDMERYSIQLGKTDQSLQEYKNKIILLENVIQQQLIKINKLEKKIIDQQNKFITKQIEFNQYLESQNKKLKDNINQLQMKNSQINRQRQYREEQFRKQIQNLNQYIDSLTKRYDGQIKQMSIHISKLQNQCQFTNQELRKRQISFQQQRNLGYKSTIKLNSIVDHLWNIKSIEYDNLLKQFQQLKVNK